MATFIPCSNELHLLLHRKPVGTLEGHTAPVFFVKADSANSRLFSIGNDNTIMVRPGTLWQQWNWCILCSLTQVWDILEFTCLNSVFPSLHKFSVPTQGIPTTLRVTTATPRHLGDTKSVIFREGPFKDYKIIMYLVRARLSLNFCIIPWGRHNKRQSFCYEN